MKEKTAQRAVTRRVYELQPMKTGLLIAGLWKLQPAEESADVEASAEDEA